MPSSPRSAGALGHDMEQLIREARSGCRTALGHLLEAFRLLLLSEANQQLPDDLRSKGGASDLVQDTFTEALRDFTQFQGTNEPQLKRWLLAILGNNLANVRRKYYDTAKSQISREVPLDHPMSWDGPVAGMTDDTPSPSQLASQREEEELLRQALVRLAEEDRQVIHFRHNLQWDFVTIGVRMGISEEAARKRFTRAIEKLQRNIEAIQQ